MHAFMYVRAIKGGRGGGFGVSNCMHNFGIIISKMKFNFIMNSVTKPILFKEINFKETIGIICLPLILQLKSYLRPPINKQVSEYILNISGRINLINNYTQFLIIFNQDS